MCEHAACDILHRSSKEHYNPDFLVTKGRILVKGNAPGPSAGKLVDLGAQVTSCRDAY